METFGLNNPIPADVILEMMHQMMSEREEWDEAPEWGFLHEVPNELIEQAAPGENVAGGLVCAPVEVPDEVWERVNGNALVVLDGFFHSMETPATTKQLELSDYLRSGLPTPVTGAWLRTEAWLPPERLETEVWRRAKTGEPPIDFSTLPDRVEARVMWGVDMWGRSYQATQARGTGERRSSYEQGDDTLIGQKAVNQSLRKLVKLLRTPVPKETRIV